MKKRIHPATQHNSNHPFPPEGLVGCKHPPARFVLTVGHLSGREDTEVTEKKGKEVKIKKITSNKLKGERKRPGTAYRLKDSKVVYVPED